MMLQFRNRAEAGEMLAGKLKKYAGHPGGLVLGLPRGGVPVGHSVARRLRLPLDVFIVRKLGVPGQEELAMGAIASGGVCAMNEQIVAALHLPDAAIAAVRAREQLELERRERQYRSGRPELRVKGRTIILVDDGIATGAMNEQIVAALHLPDAAIARVRAREQLELERRERQYRSGRPELRVKGRTIILVDDGIATGATMRAAALALREGEAGRIVVAAPVAADTAGRDLGDAADEFVAVLQPEYFQSVGQWYSDFTQVTDDEVAALLAAPLDDCADQ